MMKWNKPVLTLPPLLCIAGMPRVASIDMLRRFMYVQQQQAQQAAHYQQFAAAAGMGEP